MINKYNKTAQIGALYLITTISFLDFHDLLLLTGPMFILSYMLSSIEYFTEFLNCTSFLLSLVSLIYECVRQRLVIHYSNVYPMNRSRITNDMRTNTSSTEDTKLMNTNVSTKASIRILRIKDVCAMLGIARSTIYDWMKGDSARYDPTFPKSIPLGKSSVGWIEGQLIEWVENKLKQ